MMDTLILGPKVETISDFWEMVWEQKSSVIVMLTKVEEKGKVSMYECYHCLWRYFRRVGSYIIWIYTWQQKLNSTPSCEDKKNLLYIKMISN